MQKRMLSMMAVLAMAVSGASFLASAANASDAYLYAEPSPFAVPHKTAGSEQLAALPTQTAAVGSGNVNTVKMVKTHHRHQAPWTQDGIFGPYGPE
jgi:hypothetical protein